MLLIIIPCKVYLSSVGDRVVYYDGIHTAHMLFTYTQHTCCLHTHSTHVVYIHTAHMSSVGNHAQTHSVNDIFVFDP